MKVLLSYFAALFSSLLLALERMFPVLSERHAIARGLAILIIVIVVIIDAVAVYYIVVTPGVTTTIGPYP